MLTFFVFLIFLISNQLSFAEPPLIVGMELSYPPFETIDKKGQPAGMSVDLALALGKYLNREIVIENIPFIGLLPALKTGKINVIISSISSTIEREAAIDFTDPYLVTGLCLLISQKSNLQNADEMDQPGRVIVVKQGTTGELYASQHLKNAAVLILNKESSCVLEVVQGKADAFIYDQFSVFTNWQKNLKTTRANLEPFKKEYWAIGIRKGDDILKKQINTFLNEFKAQKGIEKLAEKYLHNQLEVFNKMGINIFLST